MKYLSEILLIALFLTALPIGIVLFVSLMKTLINEPGIKTKKIKLKGWY
jgi:hypothetical protein